MTKKAQFKFSERSKRHFEGRKSKKSANRKERHAKNQSADIYTLHSPPPSVETAYTTNKSVRPLEAKTSAQKNYINAIKNNCLTFGIGPAGTGKSYCAAAIAADFPNHISTTAAAINQLTIIFRVAHLVTCIAQHDHLDAVLPAPLAVPRGIQLVLGALMAGRHTGTGPEAVRWSEAVRARAHSAPPSALGVAHAMKAPNT